MKNFKLKLLPESPLIGKFKKVKVTGIRAHLDAVIVSDMTFSNCQTFTIGNFNLFLHYIKQDEWKIKLKELKDICWISKPLLVVDVTRYYEKRIRKVFHIVNSMEYTNANSHKMTMMIIDTRK